ncbi:MAG TPA: protoporphyrinogen oxidase, partial [Bacilli bacterium]
FPQFVEMERKHRSLILGLLAAKKSNKVSSSLPDGLKGSLFLSFRRGLGSLVETLVKAMVGVQISTGQRVLSVEKLSDPVKGRKYKVIFGRSGENTKHLDADAIILAVPAFAAAKLLSAHTAVDKLTAIPYVSVANVIMAFDRKDIKYPLDGSGFVVPRQEHRFITACTWVSSKWQHTAPEGKVLLRCYVGRSGDEQWMVLSDEELLTKVRHDLEDIMQITAKPLFFEVTRWKESMPQYAVGHLDNISQLRRQLTLDMPGVFLTGSGYHGVGIPDCIRQGKEAASHVISDNA